METLSLSLLSCIDSALRPTGQVIPNAQLRSVRLTLSAPSTTGNSRLSASATGRIIGAANTRRSNSPAKQSGVDNPARASPGAAGGSRNSSFQRLGVFFPSGKKLFGGAKKLFHGRKKLLGAGIWLLRAGKELFQTGKTLFHARKKLLRARKKLLHARKEHPHARKESNAGRRMSGQSALFIAGGRIGPSGSWCAS